MIIKVKRWIFKLNDYNTHVNDELYILFQNKTDD